MPRRVSQNISALFENFDAETMVTLGCDFLAPCKFICRGTNMFSHAVNDRDGLVGSLLPPPEKAPLGRISLCSGDPPARPLAPTWCIPALSTSSRISSPRRQRTSKENSSGVRSFLASVAMREVVLMQSPRRVKSDCGQEGGSKVPVGWRTDARTDLRVTGKAYL